MISEKLMRVMFMGTPDLALVILKALYESDICELTSVVTQPDKPKGRGHQMAASPVKVFALEKGITVHQPETLKDGAFLSVLDSEKPDMIIVAAYGKILPPYVLDHPKYGCINAHGSLLPKYRGAAPIQRAIIDGEKKTGITAMFMDKGLDTGDMILKREVDITSEDDFESLHDKLAAVAAECILDTVALAKEGPLPREKQNDAEATYAEKITKADRALDFSETCTAVRDRIRGLSPVPRAVALLPDGKMLQITKAEESSDNFGEVGTVFDLGTDGFKITCGRGSVKVLEVIPEGKGKMSAADFVRGRKISLGDVLGGKKDG